VFPTGDKPLFKPWWDKLDSPKVVERKYRCRYAYHDGKSEYTRLAMRQSADDGYMSKQWGRIVPKNDKEQAVYKAQKIDNPKGFRIYLPSNAHCCLTSYGNPTKVGPGRQTNFILDRIGIRTLTVAEAAMLHSLPRRIIQLLQQRREDKALSIIGDTVPICTYSRVFKAATTVLDNNQEVLLQLHNEKVARKATHLKDAVLIQAAKPKLGTLCHTQAEEEDGRPPYDQFTPDLIRHMYPNDSTLALAQSTDPKLNVLREKLLMLAADISRSDPKSTLEEAAILAQGISAARVRELEQYELLELSPGEHLLVKLRAPKHFYGPDARAQADPEGGGYLRVIPALLRDQVTDLHHYSSMAAHAGPEQMWSEMQRAGYWFAGGAKHCQRIYRSCHKCFRSKRPRQFLQGLQSSRRFLRWGDCVS
jgi:hypothetical protein